MAKTPAPQGLTIELAPSGQAQTALTAKQTALSIVITDKASHEVCRETLKGWKLLKRKIEDHFAAVKRPITDAKNAILEMERKELAPITEAIAIAERADVAYVQAQRRLEQEAADRTRREAEERARVEREEQQAQAEADAAKLEEASDELSDRERVFCDGIVDGFPPEAAANNAGFKNLAATVKRLMALPKITNAIHALTVAKNIRQQAAAEARKPLIVESTSQPESQIASVAGTSMRTTYGCDPNIDIAALRGAWLDGRVPADTFLPNIVALNAAARQLKELFPQAYPGCTLAKKSGIAG